ncbi:DUF4192 family protein [Nocardia terpenica]
MHVVGVVNPNSIANWEFTHVRTTSSGRRTRGAAGCGPFSARLLSLGAARQCVHENASGALVIVVESGAHPPNYQGTEHQTGRHQQLITHLRRALAAEGLPLLGGWATPSIGSGSPWWSLFGTAEAGVIPDPEASPATFVAVLRGQADPPVERSARGPGPARYRHRRQGTKDIVRQGYT